MNPSAFLHTLAGNSLQAAVLVVLVLAVQWLFRRQLTPAWRSALWLLVVARLLLPVSAGSAVSIFNFTPALRPTPAMAAPAEIFRNFPPAADEFAATPAVSIQDSLEPATTPSSPATPATPPSARRFSLTWPQILVGAWLAGALFLLTLLVLSSVRLARRVGGAVCTDPAVLAALAECTQRAGLARMPVVIESGAVATPAVFGLIRPRLLLPTGFRESFTPAQLRHIFLHELAHLRRHDLLVNCLMAVIQVVHWFNPLVWFGFARWRLERELACDAFALEALGNRHQRDYGETILQLLQQSPDRRLAPGLIGISEDRRQLRQRIAQIARFRPTRRWSLLSFVIVGGLAAIGLTDAGAQKSKDPAPPKPAAAAPAVTATPAPSGKIHELVIGVTNADTGQPLEGAEVTVISRDIPKATTNAAGLATLRVPLEVPGADRMRQFNLTVTSPRHASRAAQWTANAGNVRNTLPARYELKLTAGVTLGGTVRDERGAPVPGVKVTLSGRNSQPTTLGGDRRSQQEYSSLEVYGPAAPVSDAQGAWRVEHAPADLNSLGILATRPGGAQTAFSTSTNERSPGDTSAQISLDEAKAGSLVLTLRDGFPLRGIVTDSAGQPLAGVQLRARNVEARNAPHLFTTDAAGRFELLHWDVPKVLLTAEHPAHRLQSTVVALQANLPDLKIVLPPPTPLRLRVVDEKEQPLAGATVRVNPNPAPDQILDWNGTTDAAGRIEWTAAPEGPVSLWISAANRYRTAKLAAAPTEHVIRMSERETRAINVRLRVVEADSGRPVPAFEVWRRMPSAPYAPWGDPAANGEFRREIALSEFPLGIISGYRLQVRAPGYTGWTSDVIEFANGDQDLTVKLVKGEASLPVGVPQRPSGAGYNAENQPELTALAQAAVRLLETGDAAAFAQAALATPKDWESIPALASRRTESTMKRQQQALATSAARVLDLARRAGLEPGKVKFTVKSVGSPYNSSMGTRVDGKVINYPFAQSLVVVLAGEPTGGAPAALRGDYQLALGTAVKTPAGWRAEEGIRWQSLPAHLVDQATLRELRLANTIAPSAEPISAPLSAADDPALASLGDAVVTLVRQRDPAAFIAAAFFTPEGAADVFQRFEWGKPERAAEMHRTVGTGLAATAQAALDLQERLGLDFSDAKVTVRQVRAERPGFGRFGQIDGMRAGPIRVVFSVESSRTARSGQPLAGNYTVSLDNAVRVGERWFLMGDKLRWQQFPDGVVPATEQAQVQFENHVADKGTLPNGHLAPDVKFTRLPDQARAPAAALSAYRGKVVILEFWASWCGPCQEPMEKLQKLVADNPAWKDRVEVVALSIDDKATEATEHLAKKGWAQTTNAWAGPGGFKAGPAKAFRLRGVPTVYVIDADGKVAAAGHPGTMDLAGLVNARLAAGSAQ